MCVAINQNIKYEEDYPGVDAAVHVKFIGASAIEQVRLYVSHAPGGAQARARNVPDLWHDARTARAGRGGR